MNPAPTIAPAPVSVLPLADRIIEAGERYTDARNAITKAHHDGITDFDDPRMVALMAEHCRTYLEFCRLAYATKYAPGAIPPAAPGPALSAHVATYAAQEARRTPMAVRGPRWVRVPAQDAHDEDSFRHTGTGATSLLPPDGWCEACDRTECVCDPDQSARTGAATLAAVKRNPPPDRVIVGDGVGVEVRGERA